MREVWVNANEVAEMKATNSTRRRGENHVAVVAVVDVPSCSTDVIRGVRSVDRDGVDRTIIF